MVLCVARQSLYIATPIERAIIPLCPAALLPVPDRITSRTQRAKVACHQGQVRRLLHRHDVIDPGLALAQGYVAHGAAVAIPCHDMPPQRAPSSAIVERMLALLGAVHGMGEQLSGRDYQDAGMPKA